MALVSTIYTSGATLYFFVLDDSGQYWNGTAFESYNASNIGDYDVAMAEDGSTGIFHGTFPAGISAGSYSVVIRMQLGGSVAEGDLCIGGESYSWDGTTLLAACDTCNISGKGITCAQAVTVHANVGTDYKLGVESDGDLTKVNTLDGHTAQSGDTYNALPTDFSTLNIANGSVESDLTYIHGTALTETSGQLAGRFVDFFNQSAATFSVATALADFKATGFSTHSAADVWSVGTRALTDKAGFSLASNGLDLVTSWTVDITGTVSGNSTFDASSDTVDVGKISGDSTAADILEALLDGTGDPDTLMLWEALRQGYHSDADVIVAYADTDAGRGTNLAAAYAAAKALTPGGNALSATNRARVFVPPWHYALASTLDLDTEFVDLIALFPEQGGKRKPTDRDNSDGTTDLASFRPSRTLIYSATDDTTTVEQSSQNVHTLGFAVAQLSGDATGSYHAYYVSGDDNEGSRYDQMYFWHKAPYCDYFSTLRSPIAFAKHVKGTWNKSSCNAFGWRIGYDAEKEGQFSATMYDIECGASSIIGDFPWGEKGAHKATKCWCERCKAIGTYNTSDVSESGSNSFSGCDQWACDIDASCTFIDCEMGNRSGALCALNIGLWINCRGGNYCLASATANTAYTGEFRGIDIGGVWGKGSCGGRAAGLNNVSKLTGTLCGTTILDNELPIRAEGAVIERSTITMGTTDQDCITLLDSNSKITNSTLLVVEGGTGTPINAASALSVCASGNTYNNSGVAAKGLGSNVTNVGTEDGFRPASDTVANVTTTGSVTNAVTTDTASRDASKNTAEEIRSALGMENADLDEQLDAGATSEELGDIGELVADIATAVEETIPQTISNTAFNPETVEADSGISWQKAIAWLLAASSGKTSVDQTSGAVTFYLADGVTPAFTITYGNVPGHRSARTPEE